MHLCMVHMHIEMQSRLLLHFPSKYQISDQMSSESCIKKQLFIVIYIFYRWKLFLSTQKNIDHVNLLSFSWNVKSSFLFEHNSSSTKENIENISYIMVNHLLFIHNLLFITESLCQLNPTWHHKSDLVDFCIIWYFRQVLVIY